jgi:hypothetical protein
MSHCRHQEYLMRASPTLFSSPIVAAVRRRARQALRTTAGHVELRARIPPPPGLPWRGAAWRAPCVRGSAIARCRRSAPRRGRGSAALVVRPRAGGGSRRCEWRGGTAAGAAETGRKRTTATHDCDLTTCKASPRPRIRSRFASVNTIHWIAQ